MLHPLGFIHGRFQVLHNDHMKYLLAGKKLCEHLIVGITNPDTDLTAHEPVNPDRSSLANNPLTYMERKRMIEAALVETGIPRKDFSVVPFPICKPDMILQAAPEDAVYYLTIYDEWGREKKQRLESLGLTTHVMWERQQKDKGISGTDVRQSILENGPWQTLVPPAVAQIVEELDLQKRFREVSDSGS
ncbi:nicotinate-nucleotide adenylyltransferase [Pseudodesulfovibrio sediminis]|uniref:Cytidyltransferase-like domain-containing protein n=1 Tax=Pseudodesulfovibrio sediminis TaxID=2810563 RepID=A0ABM7P9S4_9BACT|nr:nicotinate-nucleotide adenylyltransferase [Pseudodesulfovibrio sediminis]BCS90169.1 hypothetical protein PSDVSF_34110 [Pseudodesulfovibrio sediminis]